MRACEGDDAKPMVSLELVGLATLRRECGGLQDRPWLRLLKRVSFVLTGKDDAHKSRFVAPQPLVRRQRRVARQAVADGPAASAALRAMLALCSPT